jgi:predicted transcriptional regulator
MYMTKKRVTVALEEALIKDLRHLAVERDTRFALLLEQALVQYIKNACPK